MLLNVDKMHGPQLHVWVLQKGHSVRFGIQDIGNYQITLAGSCGAAGISFGLFSEGHKNAVEVWPMLGLLGLLLLVAKEKHGPDS